MEIIKSAFYHIGRNIMTDLDKQIHKYIERKVIKNLDNSIGSVTFADRMFNTIRDQLTNEIYGPY